MLYLTRFSDELGCEDRNNTKITVRLLAGENQRMDLLNKVWKTALNQDYSLGRGQLYN